MTHRFEVTIKQHRFTRAELSLRISGKGSVYLVNREKERRKPEMRNRGVIGLHRI